MYIDCQSVYSSSSAVKQKSDSLKENKFRSIDLLAINVTTAFAILKCLEYEFLKRYLV